MTRALFKIEPSSPKTDVTKTWDLVLYSRIATIGEPGINVYRPRCKKNAIETFTTAGILDTHEIAEGVSMINTGPCRYIAINPHKYRSNTSPIVLAFSTELPVENTLLPVHLLNIGCHPLEFIPNILEIKKLKKLTNTLYFTKAEEKTYFIVVE